MDRDMERKLTEFVRAEILTCQSLLVLKEKEVMLINDYGSWWGRGCFGQSYIYDSVIKRIYNRVVDNA